MLKDKKYKRLLTGGCSFTDYAWPTWADYLGTGFDEYINCGQAGSGNSNIARNVLSNSQEGDLVVILWSGWNRQIMWNTNGCPVPKDDNNHWQYNYERWNKNWLMNFYNPEERLATSMDYIKMIDLDSQVKNYNVFHFSAFSWMLGEIETRPSKFFDKLFTYYDITNNFLLDQTLENYSKTFYSQHNLDTYISTQYNSRDRHPSPYCQYHYLIDIILPKLNIDLIIDLNLHALTHDNIVRNNFNFFIDKTPEGILKCLN